MTDNIKAKGDELVEKYLKMEFGILPEMFPHSHPIIATQCAIISVEEIMDNCHHSKGHTIEEMNYWGDVLDYLKSKL